MSIDIRYVLTDARAVALGELEHALRQVDPAYAIEGDLITLDGIEYGRIDITHRGDPICDDDLDLLTRLVANKRHPDAILAAIQNDKRMVCVQPLNSLGPRTGDVLSPLWDWLLVNREGLLAREDGHFFNATGKLK